MLVAAVLRLAGFEETLIGGDQSFILAAAADLASLRGLPLVGMKSSVGVMHTPVVSYLAAIPLFFVFRAIAVKWFFSLLDLIALAWLYHAVRRAIGQYAGAIAALLYATNPWVIEYVRWIWYPSLIATFATLAFSASLLLLAPAIRKRALYPALALICTTLMGTLHLAALPWAGVLILSIAVIVGRIKAPKENLQSVFRTLCTRR